MNIAYLQCDLRYNSYLLKNMGGGYLVQHTINRIKKLNCVKIIAGIYECAENNQLVELLNAEGIQVVLSSDNNVNSRFLDSVLKENADYLIRVGGDQCLFDVEMTKYILAEMERQNSEWFYDKTAASVLPDIVSIECLRRYKTKLLNENRYFTALEKQADVRRYYLPYPMLILYNFRANSNEGFRVCKKVIENHLNVYDLSQRLRDYLVDSKYFTASGLWRSWIIPKEYGDFFYDEKECVNPWWGKSMLDFVKKRLNKSFSVFEWGSGNSTLFWSQNVKEVVSVEHNKKWYTMMQDMKMDNVKLKYCELEYGGNYSKAIFEEKKLFDIILIDGRDRVNCARNAISCLKENGVIIWDNTQRDYYKAGYEFLGIHGFKQIEMSSIIYGLPGIEEFTSIFYRENNCLGL